MQSVANDFAQMLRSEGFAPLVTSVEAPPGIQLLALSVLLLVFAVATTSDNGNEENESKAEETAAKKWIRLVRPDAIAFRSGLVAGYFGLLKVLPSSPREGFVPDVTSLDSLQGLQFLSIALLLLVFAMAVISEEEAAEVDEKPKAELLRADAIAFRSALVAGLVGVLQTFGTSDARTELAAACRQNLVPSVANLEAPDGIQLLSVSLLLIVFALAVREDSTEQNEETESKVDLVRTDAIAFRFSVAAALLGSLKTFGGVWSVLAQILPAGPPEGFTPAIVSLEAAEGIQLLSVSVLLLTFAVAVISEEDESENESEKTSKVELVCAPAIAFRAALTAGFLGLIKMLPPSPVEGFNPAVVSLEAPEGIQLLCISVLLLVLALAISTDNIDSQEQSSFDSWVKLVKVDAIAFRSALFAGVVGVFKTFGNPHARAELASMNQAEFSSDVAILEAPEGLQLLCVALLLFVFVAAVNSEDTSKDKSEAKTKSTRMLDLVRPPTIAFRMAMVAGLIGSLMSIDSGIVSLPRVAATGEIALVLGTGVAVMLSDVPRLVSV